MPRRPIPLTSPILREPNRYIPVGKCIWDRVNAVRYTEPYRDMDDLMHDLRVLNKLQQDNLIRYGRPGLWSK